MRRLSTSIFNDSAGVDSIYISVKSTLERNVERKAGLIADKCYLPLMWAVQAATSSLSESKWEVTILSTSCRSICPFSGK